MPQKKNKKQKQTFRLPVCFTLPKKRKHLDAMFAFQKSDFIPLREFVKNRNKYKAEQALCRLHLVLLGEKFVSISHLFLRKVNIIFGVFL